MRQELRLPKRECVVRKPPPKASHCNCLALTLDALIASGRPLTRDEVLKAARQAHGERWAWLKRKPQPAPPRELVSQTNTKPARIIRRRKRWYDEDAPSASNFRDMTF